MADQKQNATGDGKDTAIFHEKQSRARCAIHAVNNILQKPKFNAESFDSITETLTPSTSFFSINPHKNMFGLGYYDVNVIATAFQKEKMQCVWFDMRKNIGDLNLDEAEGVIVNFLSKCKS